MRTELVVIDRSAPTDTRTHGALPGSARRFQVTEKASVDGRWRMGGVVETGDADGVARHGPGCL